MARSAAPRNVRVYTVNDESRYVMVRNIPAVPSAVDEALQRLRLYGEIEAHRVVPDDEEAAAAFTHSVWVQYETINNARHAKHKTKRRPVLGSVLQVAYAPQHETPDDTARKLRERRELLERRAAPRRPATQRPTSGAIRPRRDEAETPPAADELIGPQLPPSYRPPARPVVRSTTALVPRAVDRSKRRRI